MCGLFGWSIRRKSHISVGRRETLASVLACSNSTRGDKSWGVYVSCKQGVWVRRQVGDIADVADFGQYGRLPVVMAHTRQPTMGAVKEKNAHPFTVGKITLAHNGMLRNSDELDKKHGRKVRVDSQHFAFHLNEEKPFSDIEGYGTITWNHHDNPNRIYICRMTGGSMSVWGLKNDAGEKVGVAWSSDQSHLRTAVGVARVDGYPFEWLDEGQVFCVENGVFYKENKKLELGSSRYSYAPYQGSEHSRRYQSFGPTGWWEGNNFHPYNEERGYWISKEEGKWVWVQKTKFLPSHDNKDGEDVDAYTKMRQQLYFGSNELD